MIIIDIFSPFDPLISNPFLPFRNWNAIILVPILIPLWLRIKTNIIKKVFELVTAFLIKEISYAIKNSKNIHLLPVALFFYIATTNLSSILPFIIPIITHTAFTITLAITTCNATSFYKDIYCTKQSFIHLVPNNTPLALAPFIVLIEYVSANIRPITLFVRLTANIIAGHILLSIVISLLIKWQLAHIIILAQLPLILIESIVALIQGYVFVALQTFYLADFSN